MPDPERGRDLRRLLADLPPVGGHPVDAGVLGEYAAFQRAAGPPAAAEAYPTVSAHLAAACEGCAADLLALQALARRTAAPGRSQAAGGRAPTAADTGPDDDRDDPTADGSTPPDPTPVPDPLEIAEALALGRAIEVERDALRARARPDPDAAVESRLRTARQRRRLLVEAALVRQRLAARRLFLRRARAVAAGSSGHPAAGRAMVGRRPPNPKAALLLDEFAGFVDDLARLAARLGRLMVDVRRLGDDPRGPTRSQSEALVVRGLTLTRDALAVDHRMMRLQGPLAGMFA